MHYVYNDLFLFFSLFKVFPILNRAVTEGYSETSFFRFFLLPATALSVASCENEQKLVKLLAFAP